MSPAACRLCGLPLGDGAQGEFCCAGCARVFTVLQGLDEAAGEAYVRAARRLGLIPDGPAPAAADEPPDPYPPDPQAEREQRFRVEGVFCPSCTWVVERVLEAQAGVLAARFDFFSGSGTVRFDLRRSSADRLAEILAPLGYRLTAVEHEGQARISKGLTFRFIACAVITMNLMSLAVIRYARDVGLLDAVPPFLPWVELCLCVPVMWLGFVPIARRALFALLRRTLTMDALIALSAGAAFALSCAALIAGRDEIYFETAAGLLTISLLSRMIEARLRERALAATAGVMRLDVTRVRQLDSPDAKERYAPVQQVQPGAEILLLPGETVPFDGEVARGEALVSEAVLSGEPRPLRKVCGDPIVAGSRVVDGELRLTVTRRFEETRIHQIAQSLQRTLAESEGRLRSADHIAGYFVPAVVLVALAAWVARLVDGGLTHALSAAGWFPSVAVLAIACPCAFSLAGVSAITAATGALFRRGLLVKSAAQLETLHRTRTVIFDKTGTLTEGQLDVVELAWRASARPELLELVLAAEAHAAHPAAHALRAHLGAAGIRAAEVPDAALEDLPGQGRALRLGARTVRVGAAALFREPFTPPHATSAHTLVWFGEGAEALGCFLLVDALRPDAAAAIARLRAAGYRTELLSGDRPAVCEHVAAQTGLDAQCGDASLEEKVALVDERTRAGERIVYVGDGTNDALAMSAASASVAISGSTDEALTAAGFVMLHRRLGALPELLDTGRRLSRVIRGNYVWAFAFNGVFVPVAAAGYLTPLAAMLLMLLSSSAVLLNALRLRR